MKRVLAILLTLVMLAALVGCAKEETPAEVTTAEATEAPAETAIEETVTEEIVPQEIVLWHSMSDDAGVLMDEFVKEFNEGIGAEKQITVTAVFQGAYADSTTKMRTVLQTEQYDQLPDVMQIDATGIVDYETSGCAYTVDDALAVDTAYDISSIVAAPLKAWNYAGVQLGMPFSSSTTVMFYNKTLLDAAGITTAPTTFAELIAAAEALPDKTADGADLIVYAQVPNTPTLANWIGQIPGDGVDASYVVDNRNGRDATATKLVCDTEGTLLHFLTAWKSMLDAGAVVNQGSGLSDLFYAGQLVFYTTSTSNLSSLLTAIDGRFELGCAYYPRIDDSSNFGATISGSGMFMFDKGDAGKAAAAWEFVKYLASADVQARLAVGTGYFPNNTGAYDTDIYKAHVAEYPQFAVGVEQVAQTSTDMMGVTVGPSRDFYLEIMNIVTYMADGEMTPEETVAEMTTVLNGLLDQYIASNP